MRNAILGLGFVAAGLEDGGAGCDCKPRERPAYTIAVLGVPLADDDGTGAATVTLDQFQTMMSNASDIFRESGAMLTFVGELAPMQKSTLMNHDCKPMTSNPGAYTDKDKDPNEICDKDVVEQARNAFADKTPNKLVIFLRHYNDEPEYTGGHWEIHLNRKATGGYSGSNKHFVAGVGWNSDRTFYAHEMGHYLHLAHTFGTKPTTMEQAEQMVEDAGGLDVFDGDGLDDTPPDPGPGLFKLVWGEGCSKEDYVQIGKYTARPDRSNVMSYFKSCPWEMGLSAQQVERVYDALDDNRSALIE